MVYLDMVYKMKKLLENLFTIVCIILCLPLFIYAIYWIILTFAMVWALPFLLILSFL